MSLKFNPITAKFDVVKGASAYDSRFFIVDTKATILALTPANAKIGFATDTDEFYLYDTNDGEWKVASLKLVAEDSAPDIGEYEGTTLSRTDRQGYYSDTITDKWLQNVRIGAGDGDETEGNFRLSSGVLQIYTNGSWNDVVINFVFREDSDEGYELEHQPIGFEWYYEVMSGNSNQKTIEGNPMVQQYNVTIGGYSPDLILDGGDF